MIMKKILFTTPVLEYPEAGGPALRISNSIKALNTISELHIISRVPLSLLGGCAAEKYFRKNCYKFNYSPSVSCNLLEKIISYRINTRNKILNNLINITLRVLNKLYNIFKIKRTYSVFDDNKYFKHYINENEIDIVWFGYGNVSYDLMKVLKEDLTKIKMVCDTDSVWSRFILRELDIENDLVRTKKIEKDGLVKEKEEKSWVNFMDVTTAVSEEDAKYYRSIAEEENKIKIFSNVIDLEMYKVTPEKPKDLKKPCVYLAGTFWKNSPMENAARWVINDILQIVMMKIPNIHLYIIGKNSDIILNDINNDNVTITGKIESVLPYLCNSDIALVPLKFESGTRFKILEAGICGIPIVSTTLGAEGIPVTNNKDIIIADSTKSIAKEIIKLINNKEKAIKIAGKCKKLIEKKYSIDSLVEEGKLIINYLEIYHGIK